MEDGMWSFPEAMCELRCSMPPSIPNAILQTKRCNASGLKVGSFCKYKCKPGYHVPSADNPKKWVTFISEETNWPFCYNYSVIVLMYKLYIVITFTYNTLTAYHKALSLCY